MTFSERYGPWALIAGASEGTGRAFALAVARRGLDCILVARREAPLRALADEIASETGRSSLICAVDLSNADAADRIVAAAGTREVGLYVSNAGADPNSARFLDKDLGDWLELVNRNVLTTMRCCHYFGRIMSTRGRGGIVLVGSGACYGGASNMAIYSATKAFDLCMGEGLWAELKPRGVHVLNLILGRTDTPALRALLERNGLPIPASLASPDEVAEVGLARLPFGPVHNWGLQDEEAGYAPNSAAARRERTLAVGRMSQQILDGKK